MTHAATSPQFKENAHAALADVELQRSLEVLETNFIGRRKQVADKLPEFEALRDAARDIKNHTLAHLDLYLEEYERKVVAQGGHVHCAVTADDARAIILDICRAADAKLVTKGKSMIAEEIGLNDFLAEHRSRRSRPTSANTSSSSATRCRATSSRRRCISSKAQVEADFRRVHTNLPADRNLDEPEALLTEARAVLREKFLAADVGITGANFLVAETGTSIIVTNEGNGDLTQTLPRVHIVLASIEKIVPTLEDVAQFLRVLARSATGQEMSVYTTLSTGPRRPGDLDGPREYHVVLLDNGRSAMLGGRVPGHAALHPLRRLHEPLPGLSGGRRPRLWLGLSRPDGRGADAAPDRRRQGRSSAQRLDLLRALRRRLSGADSAAEADAASGASASSSDSLSPATVRTGLALWAFFARRPWLYGIATDLAARALALVGRAHGRFRWLPFARGWTDQRDFPAPQGATFQSQWRRRR